MLTILEQMNGIERATSANERVDHCPIVGPQIMFNHIFGLIGAYINPGTKLLSSIYYVPPTNWTLPDLHWDQAFW